MAAAIEKMLDTAHGNLSCITFLMEDAISTQDPHRSHQRYMQPADDIKKMMPFMRKIKVTKLREMQRAKRDRTIATGPRAKAVVLEGRREKTQDNLYNENVK